MRERFRRIRDAVMGDIILNEWEYRCVRTPEFQRLHRIKQLGNAFHAYPSAMHTRFEHSLGVCYQIKKLFSQPGFFCQGVTADEEEKRLVQLAGLLHDIVHTPFKHTLDRDTAIVPEGSAMDEYAFWFEGIRNQDPVLKRDLTASRVEFMLGVLATQEEHDLPAPYKRQIIEDTLSADLLDYTRRDAYFTTGAVRQWDERVYDHIAVAPFTNKPYLVAKITDEQGKTAESAITELTNLLQVRYILNERVYFYPVKIAADSLLTKSVRGLLMSGRTGLEQFKEDCRSMSDEGLVNYLADSDIEDASLYARRLRDRRLPRVAHTVWPHQLADHQERFLGRCFRGHHSFDQWLEYEKKIAQGAGVNASDVIIYCHDPAMQKKEPNFLIQDESESPRGLRQHTRMWEEVRSIAEKHQNLWRCYVYSLDRDDEAVSRVRRAAEDVLGQVCGSDTQ